MMQFRKVVQIAKVEEGQNGFAIARGLATAERVDADNEISVYALTAPSYKKKQQGLLNATTGAGQEPNNLNVRLQHTTQIAGKVTRIDYRDTEKEIWVDIEAADAQISDMMRRGLVTGISQAGRYGRRWHDVCNTDIAQGNHCPACRKEVTVSYYPDPLVEISLVDVPALASATFEYVKNGKTELRKFAAGGLAK